MNLPALFRSSRRRNRGSRPRVGHRLAVMERLEDRTLMATFVVNSDLDMYGGGRWTYFDATPGDGVVRLTTHDPKTYPPPATGTVNLRGAIEEANAFPGKDTILIAIDEITPEMVMRTIHDPVIIRPAVPGNRVTINGVNAGTWAFGLDIPAGNSELKDLTIINFDSNGIQLWDKGGNKIQGCYIGTDASGSSPSGGNGGYGITVESPNNIIGGTGDGEANVIANNEGGGIHIRGKHFPAHDNQIVGNFIGTDKDGILELGNWKDGVRIEEASNNLVGGVTQGSGNVISGNGENGITIIGTSREDGTNTATGNQIRGNRIGTDVAGTDMGNSYHGVFIDCASDNQIGGTATGAGNVIAFNGFLLGKAGHGVVVADDPGDPDNGIPPFPATGNAIRCNSIFSNAGRGIDLGDDSFTINDFGDGDDGPNRLQDYPVVAHVSDLSGGDRTITWMLNSTPSPPPALPRTYALDFFANTKPDPSGFGEAEEYLFTHVVTTDAHGNATVTLPFTAAQQYVSATATDLATNDTSEISMVDSDGDAIADRWERTETWGFGSIDYDEDGTPDFEIRGAFPNRIDVFVEVDAMEGRAPWVATLNHVEDAFRDHGINLVARLDEANIGRVPFPNTWTDFDNVKNNHFGTRAEQADPNTLAAKALVYRYCLFGDTYGGGDSSGLSEWAFPGHASNDFFVTLGGWTVPGGTEDQKAGTFMHELGHTLGLGHGGHQFDAGPDGVAGTHDDNAFNYKPNYHSVMNYLWQVPGSRNPAAPNYRNSWKLDYSDTAFPPLDERNLNELTGIGGHAGHFLPIVTDARPRIPVPEAGPVEWNGIPGYQAPDPANPFRRDLNDDGVETVLEGHDDWSALRYYFLEAEEFLPGEHGLGAGGEMTLDIYRDLNRLAEPDDTQLGAITFSELDGLDPSAGDLWYEFQTTRQGILTTEALFEGAADSVGLALYGETPSDPPLAVSTSREGSQRIDWQTDAGATYHLKLSGTNPDVDLRLANLVHHGGTSVTVYGTDAANPSTSGDDQFTFVNAATRKIVINGVGYHFAPAQVESVTFSGDEGEDTAVLKGGAGSDAARLWADHGELVGDGCTVAVNQVETQAFIGNAGDDTAVLYGGAGSDTAKLWPNQGKLTGNGYTLTAYQVEAITAAGTSDDVAILYDSEQSADFFLARPNYGNLSGPGFANRAAGFGTIHAIAAPGQTQPDSAKLFDSDGADVLVAKPELASLTYEDGGVVRAKGFGHVVARANADGADLAMLYDAANSKDAFSGKRGYSKLYGPGFFNVALGFEKVFATATPGQGHSDVAALYDAAGDDVLVATPEFAKLKYDGGEDSFVRASGFRRMLAHATQSGDDVAVLRDSGASSDTFVGAAGDSALYGPTFYNRAIGFEKVIGYASGSEGGDDRAKLYDSDGDDVFYAGPTSPGGTRFVTRTLAGNVYRNVAQGFRYVYAYARNGGSDTARLYDSDTSRDVFVGRPAYSTLYGPGFLSRAVAFEQVIAHASANGLYDRAKLLDSDGNDTLVAGPSSPYGTKLFGTTRSGQRFSIAADGFYQVYGHSAAGGSDKAHLYGLDGNKDVFRAFLTTDYCELYDGSTFRTIARAFAEVTAHGVKSDDDQAFLFDSALDDYLEADATVNARRAALSNASRSLEAYDFSRVKATCSAGNDTKHVAPVLDYTLQTIGDWIDV